jgi:hypothetical protein
MDGFRFYDLKRTTQVGVYFSEVALAFSEAMEDIEVEFTREDGHAILAILELILAAKGNTAGTVYRPCLIHRFRNLDEGSDAAFRVREHLGGVEMTLVRSLKKTKDLTASEIGGMSVCISRDDARTLTDAYSSLLNSSSSSEDSPPTS